MTTITRSDTRVRQPAWDASAPGAGRRRAMRFLLLGMVPLALFYFTWLLQGERIGHPVLYALLIAARHGAGYLRREESSGAKPGNINHALRHTDAPFVLVLDCDHIPEPRFL